jgi:hypothetical protein
MNRNLIGFLPSFGSFGQAVSEENNFKKSTNQKQELPVAAMFLTDQDEMSNLYRGPSKVFKLQFIWVRGFRGED